MRDLGATPTLFLSAATDGMPDGISRFSEQKNLINQYLDYHVDDRVGMIQAYPNAAEFTLHYDLTN